MKIFPTENSLVFFIFFSDFWVEKWSRAVIFRKHLENFAKLFFPKFPGCEISPVRLFSFLAFFRFCKISFRPCGFTYSTLCVTTGKTSTNSEISDFRNKRAREFWPFFVIYKIVFFDNFGDKWWFSRSLCVLCHTTKNLSWHVLCYTKYKILCFCKVATAVKNKKCTKFAKKLKICKFRRKFCVQFV